MANWCWNQTIFYGNENKLKKIYNKIAPTIKENIRVGKNMCLDILLTEFGCSQKELDSNYFIRGYFEDIELFPDGALSIWYETAWNPEFERIDEILKKYEPSIKEVTLAEELGNLIFINTDKEKKYFKDEYYLDITTYSESKYGEHYNDIKYHENLETVVEELKDIFKIEKQILNYDEVTKLITELSKDDNVNIIFESLSLD